MVHDLMIPECPAMFDRLANAAQDNPALARRCRILPLTIGLAADGEVWTVKTGGDGLSLGKGPSAAADFTISGPASAWAEFAKPVPAIGFQSVVGMVRAGHLTLDGDLLAFARAQTLLELLFVSLRAAPSEPAPQPVGEPWIEPVTGRYLHLDIAGMPHRLYFEEAGPADGIPLLCLHTAGADGRQYRGVLNDAEVTKTHRVIVFDMPWHGKSSPPQGFERIDYKLTTDSYMALVMAVVRALKLDRPIVMGCSIGGRAVMHLALRHGEAFRAAIGLQSSAAPDPGKVGKLYELAATWRLDVHGGEASAGSVACLMAPDAPAADRWETLWHYMSGGPGVFYGDIQYYSAEGLMSDAEAEALQASACPIYMLTGDYDLSATPALSQALADRIQPAHFEVMHGLGHFPMSESPARFLQYLRPLLDKIASR